MFHGLRGEWAREFANATYEPTIFIFALLVGACNFPVQAAISWVEMDSSGAGLIARLLGCAPLLVCSVLYFLFYSLFQSKSYKSRAFCQKQYGWFRLLHILAGSIASLWAKVSIEIHRSTYGFSDPDQIHLKLGYSVGSYFTRTCIDTDPNKTWTARKISDRSVGCNNAVLGADIMCLCGFSCLLPAVFSMPPRLALLCNMLVFALVAVALLVCNTTGFQLFSVLLVQLISGLSGAFLAEICHNIEIQQFLDSKRTAALAAKNRALLNAFIPKSVVPRLVNTNDGEFICANISEVAIMFCKVKSYEELNRDFSLQTFRVFQDLFCKFDDAVQRFGMYKYQVQLPRLNIFCRCDVTVSPAAAASRGMVHCGLSARRQALRRGRRPQ